ncbi:hypothetical protein BJ986_001867 [Phycicoccus badiiscoriae]|uniref:Right handed beta helix domain-containing protein n=1 Tax=Pedococcus badiiscoriae TaxID=642776 RepID=A0A852WF42_9MICO|nr:hypothetical protein [Pedococcus badiiscoriae]NYG07380.1 hypothetical protein [Pedococcus badiiscoriae]
MDAPPGAAGIVTPRRSGVLLVALVGAGGMLAVALAMASHHVSRAGVVATVTTREPARKSFPTTATTGLSDAMDLSPYRGDCTISDGSSLAIHDADVAAMCSALVVSDGSVTVTGSRLPRVEVRSPGTLTVRESDIQGGDQSQFSAVLGDITPSSSASYHLVISGTEIRGGKDSVECSNDCLVEHSYLHDQRSYGGAHIQGFLSSGGRHITVRGNAIACDPPSPRQGEGCTADLALFGDNAQVSDVLVEGNIFLGGPFPAFCIYGGYEPLKPFPTPERVRFVDNVFERGPYGTCGRYGPVSSVKAGTVWTCNTWSDGAAVVPTT